MTRSVNKPIPQWVLDFYSYHKDTIEGRTMLKIYEYLNKNGITLTYYLKGKGLVNDAPTCLRRMKLGKLPSIISLSKMSEIFTRQELCWLIHYWHDEYFNNMDINSGKLINDFVDTDFIDFEYVDMPELFYGCTTITGKSVAKTVTERFVRKRMNILSYLARSLELGVSDEEAY